MTQKGTRPGIESSPWWPERSPGVFVRATSSLALAATSLPPCCLVPTWVRRKAWRSDCGRKCRTRAPVLRSLRASALPCWRTMSGERSCVRMSRSTRPRARGATRSSADEWQHRVEGSQMEQVRHVAFAARYPQPAAIGRRAMPGHDEDAETRRVDEGQLFEIKQDLGSVACLTLSQCTLQARALG